MTTRLGRRRFLTFTAAAAFAGSAHAETIHWQGTGLGAALSLRLVGGTSAQAQRTFVRVAAEIGRIEATASLHRDSALTRLNRDGHLAYPSSDLLDLLALSGRIHAMTGGAFDPTVQPLWLAIATGGDTKAARDLIGWDRVTVAPQKITLGRGQALTLNGIAQGWAADRIAEILRREGYGNALIDMGEVQALGYRENGAAWRARIQSPEGETLHDTCLSNRALATSSPRGTMIGQGQPHILGPGGQSALWSTVSVSAPSAALADALSTAFCLMSQPQIEEVLATLPQVRVEAIV